MVAGAEDSAGWGAALSGPVVMVVAAAAHRPDARPTGWSAARGALGQGGRHVVAGRGRLEAAAVPIVGVAAALAEALVGAEAAAA